MVICLPNVHTEAAPEAPGGLEGRNSIKESWQQVRSSTHYRSQICSYILHLQSPLLSSSPPPLSSTPLLLSSPPLHSSSRLLHSSPQLLSQSLARCLSKEEWVAAQSIKVIGNTAIPVVKLKTHTLTPPSFSSQGGGSYYENESRHDHGSDRKRNPVRTSSSSGNSNRTSDASADAGMEAMPSGGCSGGIDTNSGGGSVLSLDISFEGPGHYGLEANKMTTSLIKVLLSLPCMSLLPSC